MAGITLEHLTKTYRHRREERRALDGLHLTIEDREFMVLVGPSGCGKTTTLRLIAGLETPSAGTIRIGDRVVNDVLPRDRDVAMVFQNLALYPHMSAFDNMAFGLKMRGEPKAEIRRKVVETATILGIETLLTRRPAALSGGERQRVALGRAVVRRPKVFLLDEPLSSLDAKMRVRMRGEMRALHRRLQTTMLHVTHDQEEAMTLGDRIAVLDDGVLQQTGAPLELYRRPANRFVAAFIGTPTMNFVPGRLERNSGALLFDCALGRLDLPRTSMDGIDSAASGALVLGVRPEHVCVDVGDPGAAGTSNGLSVPINARVQFTEHLGDRAFVHLVGPREQTLVARANGAALPEIDRHVTARIKLDEIHFFTSDDSGRRVSVV